MAKVLKASVMLRSCRLAGWGMPEARGDILVGSQITIASSLGRTGSAIAVDCGNLYAIPCTANMLVYGALASRGYVPESMERMLEDALSTRPPGRRSLERLLHAGLEHANCFFLDVEPGGHEAVVEAARSLGVQLWLGMAVWGLEDAVKRLDSLEGLSRLLDGRGRVGLVVHEPMEHLDSAQLLARSLPAHSFLALYASYSRSQLYKSRSRYGAYPVELLEARGLLGENSILACSGWIASWEIGLAGRRKTSIVDCPTVSATASTGSLLPYSSLLASGVRLGLGTLSLPVPDVLEEARLALALQRHYLGDKRVTPGLVLSIASTNPLHPATSPPGVALVEPVYDKLDEWMILSRAYRVLAVATTKPALILLDEKVESLLVGEDKAE
ncbi:MAG: hypothetical protein ABWW69_01765 [Pyrodictiaceae archaeon]